MIILLIIGGIIFGTGLASYLRAVNSGEIINTVFGMLFSMGIMILGGLILVIDLIVLIVFLTKRTPAKVNEKLI